MLGRARQCRRVAGFGVLVELSLMTTAAQIASRVLARCNASQCEEDNDKSYQMSRPLNWI